MEEIMSEAEIKLAVVQYIHIKNLIDSLEKWKRMLGERILKFMKETRIKRIKGPDDWNITRSVKSVFLPRKRIREILQICPFPGIIKVISIPILDKKKLQELTESGEITPEQAEKVLKIAQREILIVWRKKEKKGA